LTNTTQGSGTDDHRSALLEEIRGDEESAREDGRRNHKTDLWLSAGAILGSFVATVVAVADTSPWFTAAVAAIPGLCAGLQSQIKFAGRSSWYFLLAARLRSLGRALEIEEAPVKEIAKKLGDLEVEMEERWREMIGGGGQAPPNRMPAPNPNPATAPGGGTVGQPVPNPDPAKPKTNT
jgi:hypothetical protein